MKSTIFWVESKDAKGKEQIVGHGKSNKTGEIFFKHISRSSAMDLLKAEKKVSPEYKYRIVKEVKEMITSEWE